MCGDVRVDGGTETDPRRSVPADARIEITGRRYVSRGGEKLAAALEAWGISPTGRVWLDAGASTGGFTDCLLQGGATAVHAVDVGYNQLDFSLRRDTRVVVHERTNIGDLHETELDPPPDAAVCDLSFRSLRGVLRSILDLTRLGWGIALLKPQFELAAEHRWGGRATPNVLDAAGGVARGSERDEVIERVCDELERDEGVVVLRRMTSPVAGRGGNREVLLLVGRAETLSALSS